MPYWSWPPTCVKRPPKISLDLLWFNVIASTAESALGFHASSAPVATELAATNPRATPLTVEKSPP